MDIETQVAPVKELLNEIVVRESRHAINIIPEHITLLHGTKLKKQHSRKRKSTKSTNLTRKEASKLGLYTLPTKKLKYEEALPLYRLWKGYIKEHLNLHSGDKIPQVYEPSYDAFSKLLVKCDLHGAKIKITKSKCKNFVDISGIVIMETKNILKILGEDNRLRSIPKRDCIFEVKLGNTSVVIFGKHLNIRPVERAVRKIKNFIDPEL